MFPLVLQLTNPEQRESAAGAMKNLGIWYAHTATVVWMLHYLPPSLRSDAYNDGGWRSLEREAAAIATRPGDLLDIDLEFRTLVVDKALQSAAEAEEAAGGACVSVASESVRSSDSSASRTSLLESSSAIPPNS